MNRQAVITALTELSADLSPSPQAGMEDLRLARAAIAAAAATIQADGFPRAPRSLAPAPTDPAVAQTFAEITQRVAAGEPAAQLVARRGFPTTAVPAPDAGASDVAGRAVSQSFGPFLDRAGRPVWIDIFPVSQLTGVIRAGGVQPFLYIAVPVGAPPAGRLTLGPGSVWVSAAALAGPAAPVNGWCGLRIK
ncbi:MAG TPA: hypothetical protein VE993_10725, partial [Stellaceae bacterium]|nr:hypothetical protein [Stellaceae bacterium]